MIKDYFDKVYEFLESETKKQYPIPVILYITGNGTKYTYAKLDKYLGEDAFKYFIPSRIKGVKPNEKKIPRKCLNSVLAYYSLKNEYPCKEWYLEYFPNVYRAGPCNKKVIESLLIYIF